MQVGELEEEVSNLSKQLDDVTIQKNSLQMKLDTISSQRDSLESQLIMERAISSEARVCMLRQKQKISLDIFLSVKTRYT